MQSSKGRLASQKVPAARSAILLAVHHCCRESLRRVTGVVALEASETTETKDSTVKQTLLWQFWFQGCTTELCHRCHKSACCFVTSQHVVSTPLCSYSRNPQCEVAAWFSHKSGYLTLGVPNVYTSFVDFHISALLFGWDSLARKQIYPCTIVRWIVLRQRYTQRALTSLSLPLRVGRFFFRHGSSVPITHTLALTWSPFRGWSVAVSL